MRIIAKQPVGHVQAVTPIVAKSYVNHGCPPRLRGLYVESLNQAQLIALTL